MGVPAGVTLIEVDIMANSAKAIELGVYNHVPLMGANGTPCNCVKWAEDGRSITGVDISPFINNYPKAVHDSVLHSECQWQYFAKRQTS